MLAIAFRLAACINAVIAWWMGVRLRPRRQSRRPVDSNECRMAVHEAGHALVAWACSTVLDIHDVTIELKTGGHVHYRRWVKEEPDYHWCDGVVSLSGLAAELLVYAKTKSKPAEKDLTDALAAVRQVGESRPPWGRLPTLIHPSFAPAFATRPSNAELAALGQCYSMARHVIVSHGDKLDRLVALLLTKRTVTEKEIESLLGGRFFLCICGMQKAFFLIPKSGRKAA
jgi:ATP-dependent Zn protease